MASRPDEEDHTARLYDAAVPDLDVERSIPFTPGTIIAGRYRVVSLLGTGGMGQVYRAEDLKLGYSIALKFLPRRLSHESSTLERLYSEVRIGRQVSHPNVCRLYDIAETDGQPFIAMEYVDGEDLASLLRRIGHLPGDKALDIAGGLCAGLAAAHDRGVVHGDLKPANVMIDSRGKPRITDFGLAIVAEDARARSETAGTPAYMAPEQLAGKGASFKSDVYALGLILYEMFTGKRIFDGSLMDIVEQHRAATPPTLPRDVDPNVAALVLRCLEEDPGARPSSVYDVMAGLYGADPLAIAIAAGETPSPAMVAAAGKEGDLPLAPAWTLLALALGGTLLSAHLMGLTLRRVVPEKSPLALADRASQIIGRLGYPERAGDSASFFLADDALLAEGPRESWRTPGTRGAAAITFWYRQSPTSLVAINPAAAVTRADPTETVPGMVAVNIDSRGRLLELRAVPPAFGSSATQEPNWSRLFAEAGLDLDRFTPSKPEWTPPFGSDTRAAWNGLDPHRGNVPVHVEAAAYGGSPVWFRVIGPMTRDAASRGETAVRGGVRTLFAMLYITGIVAGAIMARRNAHLGRGDRKGATRVAVLLFVLRMLYWVFRADHVPVLSTEYERLVIAIGRALFSAAFVWILYMALEPYVRRRWPEMMISWNRALAGRFRDPLVGRDILMGAIAGVVIVLIGHVALLTAGAKVSTFPRDLTLESWRGGRSIVWLLVNYVGNALLLAFLGVFLLVLFRVLLRRQWLAMAAWVALLSTLGSLWFDSVTTGLLFGIPIVGLVCLIATRVGFLAVFAAAVVRYILLLIPMTLDFSAWYAGTSMLALLLVAAIAFYGFHVSLAGKPMFGRMLEQ
jgi:serine/threonine-protein kinase